MKNKILIITLLGVGICTACGNKKQAAVDTGFNVITLDPKQKVEDNSFISHIADSIEYIPLQTTDSVVIGKIGKIIFWNNHFYVLDRLTETIFCFDNKGKFLNKLSKKGVGPGEYYSITDFNISKNGEIWVYSSAQAFFKYDISNSRFLKRIPTAIVAESFWIDDNDTISIYVGGLPNPSVFSDFPKQYAFVQLYNQKIVSKSMPYTYHDELRMNPAPNNILSVCGNSILLFDYYENKVYSIINGQLKPQYKISFVDDQYTVSLNNICYSPKTGQEVKI